MTYLPSPAIVIVSSFRNSDSLSLENLMNARPANEILDYRATPDDHTLVDFLLKTDKRQNVRIIPLFLLWIRCLSGISKSGAF